MEAVGVAASIVTLVALTKELVTISRKLLNDVQDAPKELVRVSNQLSLISLELECVKRVYGFVDLSAFLSTEESSILSGSLVTAKTSMILIQKTIEKCMTGKSRLPARVSWALFDSKTVNKCLGELQKIESHLLLITNIIHMTASIRIQQESAGRVAQVLQELKAHRDQVPNESKPLNGLSRQDSSSTDTESSIAFQHRYTFAFSAYWRGILGSELHLSKAQNEFQNAYQFYMRVPWPSYPSKSGLVLSLSFRRLFGILPNISILGGNLSFVHMIPEDSEVVIACKKGDTLAVRDLFHRNKAAPNDMGPEEHALLYYAASSGSVELVRFLINAGAPVHPNQMLAASYFRQPGVARLLLRAGANVEVLGRDGHTVASYLYRKKLPKIPQTEFLEILASNSFSAFSSQDARGWTALHRAAAWGTAADVRVLLQMQASTQLRTSRLGWTPHFVAVCYRNLDTLQELCKEKGSVGCKDQSDFRGWNLLHMAAGYGSFHAVPFLIQKGVSLEAKSRATSRFVPRSLSGRCVTPNEIARCFGKEAYEIWVDAVHIGGAEVDVRLEDVDWSVEDVAMGFGRCECCDTWDTGVLKDG